MSQICITLHVAISYRIMSVVPLQLNENQISHKYHIIKNQKGFEMKSSLNVSIKKIYINSHKGKKRLQTF